MATVDNTVGETPRYLPTGTFNVIKTYEASSLAQNDIVQMIDIDAGVTVVDVQLAYDAMGGSTTLSIGDGDSATTFAAATASTSAGRLRATGLAKTYASGGTLQFTMGGGAGTGTVQMIATCTAATVDLA